MTAPACNIGPATDPDRDDVAALLAAQLREHGIELDGESLQHAVTGILADDRLGFFLLAREGGQAIGVACVAFIWTLEHGGRSAWLDELYVLPERRGTGIGKSLLDEVLRLCRERGCIAVDLEVDEEHSRAANLYSREGFRQLPRRRWVRTL